MNPLGDCPTDLLFGLIALNNDLVAPAVIPAAYGRTSANRTGSWPISLSIKRPDARQRDLVSTLSGDYINRHGGDAGKALAALIATPLAGERLDQLGDHEFSVSLTSAGSVGSTVRTSGSRKHLPPSANAAVGAKSHIAGYEILEVLGIGGMGIVYKCGTSGSTGLSL